MRLRLSQENQNKSAKPSNDKPSADRPDVVTVTPPNRCYITVSPPVQGEKFRLDIAKRHFRSSSREIFHRRIINFSVRDLRLCTIQVNCNCRHFDHSPEFSATYLHAELTRCGHKKAFKSHTELEWNELNRHFTNGKKWLREWCRTDTVMMWLCVWSAEGVQWLTVLQRNVNPLNCRCLRFPSCISQKIRAKVANGPFRKQTEVI